MRKEIIVLVFGAMALALTALNVVNAEDSAQQSSKSVAWYVANIRAAKAKNQECHDNPDIQASQDCSNALHALEISFTGGN